MNLRQKKGKMIPGRNAEMQGEILSRENDKYVVKSKPTWNYDIIITMCSLWN